MAPRIHDFPLENALSAEIVRRQRQGGAKELREPKFIQILGVQAAPHPDAIQGWLPHNFDYPAMVQLVFDGRETGGSGQRGVVFAHPYRNPPDAENTILPVIRSRGGKLWIPYPGKWLLQYVPADNSSNRAIFGVVYDDTCGAMEAERKAKHVGLEDDVITILTANATDVGIGDMTPQTCDGQVVQNIGAVDLWWKRGRVSGNPAAVGDGGLIPPGGSLELIGDLAYPWPINLRADGANCDVYFLKVVS